MEIAEKYRCLKCGGGRFSATSTLWTCTSCRQEYPCLQGMPKLYFDNAIGTQDRKLRDEFYDGVFGSFYGFMMPFVVLPVRPMAAAWGHWLLFAAACAVFVLLSTWG